MEWLHTTPLLVWLGVALVTGVLEVVSTDFVFAMFTGGAVSAGVAAGVGAPPEGQVLVFSGVSALLLVAARPPLKRYLVTSAPFAPTGSAALIGREAKVLVEVTEKSGRVALAGETWSARMSPTAGIPGMLPGDLVQVEAIDGATAVVAPAPVPPRPRTRPEVLPPD